MKSGTSTLHELLARIKPVFMPREEIYFFSIDDVEQHPEFFVDAHGRWTARDFDRSYDEYLAWYAAFFERAPEAAVIGEDSTSYLHSDRCAGRIAKLLPNVRLIFLLRDPAARTYSHYWHLVRTGRATAGFEETLRRSPGTLYQRSRYLPSLKRYLDHFPREQVSVQLFEDLVADPARVVLEAATHAGISGPFPPLTAVHRNPARVPRSVRAQLLRNRLFPNRPRSRFAGHLPGTHRPDGLGERVIRGRGARLNLTSDRRPPPMHPETHRFLDDVFARENDGLAEILGRDLGAVWFDTLTR